MSSFSGPPPGSQIIYTDDIVFSSSHLINTFLSDNSEETREYIQLFKSRYSLDSIHNLLESMSDLKVLVIGDTILDDYHYCDPIGKSSKDPTLAVLHKSNDMFVGGVLAVTNHIANFAGTVTVATVLGENQSYEQFVLNNLKKNIKPFFYIKPNAPTIIKRRYVDGYSFSKLLGVYIMNNSELPVEKDNEFCSWLEKEIKKYDLVVAADFGHGTISEKIINVYFDTFSCKSGN